MEAFRAASRICLCMRRVALSTLGLLLIMCGGASKPAEPAKSPEDAAREAKQRELDALFKEEPKTPYQLEKSRTFHASRDCGQGPFVVEVPALSTKHGEKLDVYACAPRDIAGRVRVSSEWDHGPQGEGHAFGYTTADNQRCRASEVEVARIADAGAPSPNPTTPSAKSGPSHSGAATKPEGEQLVEDAAAALEVGRCPEGLRHLSVSSNQYSTRSGPALHGKLRVEIWSAEPNDLRSVLFVVQQLGVDPSVTDEAFDKLMKDHDAWYQRYLAFEKSHDDLFVRAGASAAFAPPPPPKAERQPPKPSVHAEWVPGYYHRSGEAWAWIPGWWRVPDADVQAKLTVVAPAAPPPPREESSEQGQVAERPAPDAVWATGHWQWDGGRWVWVAGAWRLPPQPGSQWRAPSWRPESRGFVFVPGGWSIRMR